MTARESKLRAAAATASASAPITTVTLRTGAAKAAASAPSSRTPASQAAVSLPPPNRDPDPAASTTASKAGQTPPPSPPLSPRRHPLYVCGSMTPYDAASSQGSRALTDGFGRTVTYLRVSVTDRCDLRCVYCMSEHMTFLPKAEVLTLEELDRIASAFVGLGVKKLRITGGEPLVRKNVMGFIEGLSRHVTSGALQEPDPDHQRDAARTSSPGHWPRLACDGSTSRWIRSTRTCSAR